MDDAVYERFDTNEGFQAAIERRQQSGGQRWQALILLHDVQVDIRPNVEEAQYLVEHLPVLCSR